MRRSPLASLALCLLASAACSRDVVAVYRGGRVTRAEWIAWIEARGREAARREPLERLQALVASRVLADEARQSGLAANPELAIRLEGEELAQWRGVLQRHLRDSIEIPAAEVDEYLEAHRADLQRPRRVRLWNLFKRVPEGASSEAREAVRREAEALRERLLAGEDFQALAASASDSQTRVRGGRMGAVPPGTLRPEIEAVAFGLAAGEISPVIETPDGFTILRCHGIVEASTTSEAEGRRLIREAMERWRFKEEWPALLEELATRTAVEIDTAMLTRPAAAGADVVARGVSGALTRGDLEALAAGSVGATARLEDAEAIVRRHFTAVELRRHAIGLGLELDEAARAALAHRQERLLAEAALERRVEASYRPPTVDELRTFFESRPGRFARPVSYRLGLLRFAFEDATLPAATRAAEAASREARSAAGFEAVALRLAREPTVTVRPDTGWLPRRRVAGLGPALLETVEGLVPGTTSEAVLQDRALWVVRLHGFEPSRPLAFEAAAAEARSLLEVERRKALRNEALAALLADLDLRLVAPLPESPTRSGNRGRATRTAGVV